MQDHRKLRVWREAHEIAVIIRRICNRFPRRGYAKLRTQIVDAAESVVLTIIEGCGAASQKEFARFLDMSIKSSRELEGQLELAKDHGAIDTLLWNRLTADIIANRKGICVLRWRVLASEDPADRASRNERRQVKDNPDTQYPKSQNPPP